MCPDTITICYVGSYGDIIATFFTVVELAVVFGLMVAILKLTLKRR